MHRRYAVFGAISIAALISGVEPMAIASPPSSSPPPPQAAVGPTRSARTWLRLDIRRSSAWVGQAIPITLRASFRDVEGVTLEGTPQLKSDAVFTSELSPQPGQSTEIIDGEQVLVATWTGTITPSTAGPIALSAELPVRIRFHDAPPRAAMADPFQDDPFANMDIDPSDPTSIQRLFQYFQQSFSQPFAQSLGRAHDDTMALKAASLPVEVRPLPVSGQPAGFSGAVGRFEVRASVAETKARASEPVILRVTVQGEGDLDRVDLPGEETSVDWKAYPVTSKIEAHAPGKTSGRKTFEQVLIPLHGGQLTIPAIALAAFDPVTGRYSKVETAPFTLTVGGAPAQSISAEPTTTPTSLSADVATVSAPPANLAEPPPPSSLVESPRALFLPVAPVLALILAAAVTRLWRRRDDEKALRRTLRRAAKQGTAATFFDSARHLIVAHFAKRWGVAPEEVTADSLRHKLGPMAAPLVAAISTADALRFGRGEMEPTELLPLCSLIEGRLREIT
jgi:hypothetical protein